MFEAHFSYNENFQCPEKPIAQSWTDTYYRKHIVSSQALRIWFAKGTKITKNKEERRKIFAYIEYQDEQGKNRNRCLEFPPDISVTEALDEAIRMDLVN